jgi:hypothetical protein
LIRLEIIEKDDWIGKNLAFELQTFDESRATDIFKDNPEEWMKQKEENLSKEEAITLIQTKTVFQAFVKVRLLLLDKNAFEVIGL